MKTLYVYLIVPAVLLLALSAALPIIAQSETTNTDIQVDYAVVYGEAGSKELLLDVYRPVDREDPRPAVMVFHPGGGVMGSREWVSSHAEGLAAGGYIAFNVAYRLLGDDESNPWPAQIDDAQLAVRWVRANAAQYNVDPDRICAFGVSFGGQLAALLGIRDTTESSTLELSTYSSHVNCVVSAAGGLDATQPSLDEAFRESTIRLMGGTLSEVPEQYHDASPLAQVGEDTAPFLIFHGGVDQYVSAEDARNFVDTLHVANVEVVYAYFPTADHFYWFEWEPLRLETLAFLERHLHPQR